MKITTELKAIVKVFAKDVEAELLFRDAFPETPDNAFTKAMDFTKSVIIALENDDKHFPVSYAPSDECMEIFETTFSKYFPDHISSMSIEMCNAFQHCVAERLKQRIFTLNAKGKLSESLLTQTVKFQSGFSQQLVKFIAKGDGDTSVFHESEQKLVARHFDKFYKVEPEPVKKDIGNAVDDLFGDEEDDLDGEEDSEEEVVVVVKQPQPFKHLKPQNNVVSDDLDVDLDDQLLNLDEVTYVTKASKEKFARKQAGKTKKQRKQQQQNNDKDLI